LCGMWRWRLMVRPLEGTWGRGDWLRSDRSDNTVAGLIRDCNTTAWLVGFGPTGSEHADRSCVIGTEIQIVLLSYRTTWFMCCQATELHYWKYSCVAKLPNYVIHVLPSYRATLLTVLMCCQATELHYWQYSYVAKLPSYITDSTHVLPSYRTTWFMCCQATELHYWQYCCGGKLPS
jgi:hypothetical protein